MITLTTPDAPSPSFVHPHTPQPTHSFKKAHVTHPELKTTFYLPIIGVKKNPQSRMFTTLGVMTKGTVVEVNTSELGLVTPGGKVVWGKYAQVTNNPENDGVVNALLLV